jgi:hypothetical protein
VVNSFGPREFWARISLPLDGPDDDKDDAGGNGRCLRLWSAYSVFLSRQMVLEGVVVYGYPILYHEIGIRSKSWTCHPNRARLGNLSLACLLGDTIPTVLQEGVTDELSDSECIRGLDDVRWALI